MNKDGYTIEREKLFGLRIRLRTRHAGSHSRGGQDDKDLHGSASIAPGGQAAGRARLRPAGQLTGPSRLRDSVAGNEEEWAKFARRNRQIVPVSEIECTLRNALFMR